MVTCATWIRPWNSMRKASTRFTAGLILGSLFLGAGLVIFSLTPVGFDLLSFVRDARVPRCFALSMALAALANFFLARGDTSSTLSGIPMQSWTYIMLAVAAAFWALIPNFN